ncbi:hypothetical protein KE513_00465 [Oscillospiraceae bacterium Marseille-Q3528]|nr:hypothetical protein [Oscillospiraceae bacterium Marseille-Q3528]
MNIVNDILVNTLFPDTDFVQTLDMDSVVPKYVENQEKGNPSVCKNCAEAPFRDLHIYGRSEQVTTTGAQLLDLTDLIGKTETKNGATYKINEDQSISVSGTPTEYTSFYLKRMQLKAGSYYFESNQNNNNVFIQMLGNQVNMNNGFTLDEDADTIDVYMVFSVLPNNKQEFNLTFTSMLNAGETPLPWEPYTGGKPSPSPDYPQEIVSAGDDGNLSVIVKKTDNEQMQSVSLSTPNGLPGIPVSSGGNYTDPQGQQWICDEVDLGRGVYVQRVDKGAFDVTKALTEQSVILATPIETPLTASEIADYKSLRTYKGTTIVEAEDKAGISVKYNMPMPELSKNGALRRWFKRHPII